MTLEAGDYLFPYHFTSRDWAEKDNSFVKSGGSPSIVDTSTVQVNSGSGYAGGSLVSWSQTNVSISAASSDPRKDLVIINTSGTPTSLTGTENPAVPSSKTGPKTQQPEPPIISSDEIVVGEIWVNTSGVQEVYDRRIFTKDFLDHSGRHKDGGADEIDVSELAGGLGNAGDVPVSDGLATSWMNGIVKNPVLGKTPWLYSGITEIQQGAEGSPIASPPSLFECRDNEGGWHDLWKVDLGRKYTVLKIYTHFKGVFFIETGTRGCGFAVSPDDSNWTFLRSESDQNDFDTGHTSYITAETLDEKIRYLKFTWNGSGTSSDTSDFRLYYMYLQAVE